LVDWQTSKGLVPYLEAVNLMQDRVKGIAAGHLGELIWVLEHPPLYTAGTSAKPADLIDADRFAVFKASRGGQYTYHGPGQRVAYVMLDVGARGRDVRKFVNQMESWVIATLAEFGVIGERRAGRVGVWVVRHDLAPDASGQPPEHKIAAIGVRLRKWMPSACACANGSAFTGYPSMLTPILATTRVLSPAAYMSLVDLGLPVAMEDVDLALKKSFQKIFG